MKMLSQTCSICDKEGVQLCGKCHVARYCSREHQKEHWKVHKNSCFPCRIEYNDKIGRHLVATRDITAGELIIRDPPLVVGPQYCTKPICLGCNGSVDGKHSCKLCGYPLCTPKCPQIQNHRRECEVIQMSGKKANLSVGSQVNPMYQCITPLRCLWMKLKAEERWKCMTGMEAHLKERRESGRYEEVQSFIVRIIQNYFKLDMFSEEEIQIVCGIIETNGFEVPELNLTALFGFGYLLEHSCIPNTNRTYNNMLHLIVTAAVDIRAGDHITTSYINPLWGERIRKVHLMKFKYFACSCPRCVDPTDLGTNLSSVKCNSCSKGIMHPPQEITSSWTCRNCGKAVDACEVEENLVTIYKQRESLIPTLNASEKFLKETRRTLSENHQYRVETKLALLQMYGRGKDLELDQISDDELNRKKNLCDEVLAVANLFAPGLSRIRGIILYELHATYREQFRRLHKKIKTSEEGKALLRKAEETLDESVKILKQELHLKEEMDMVNEAEESLKLIQEWKKGKFGDERRNRAKKQANKGL